MARHVVRSVSYSRVQKSRKIEIYFLSLVVLLIVVLSGMWIYLRRLKVVRPFIEVKCGPEFLQSSVNISDAEKIEGNSYKTKDGTMYPQGTHWHSNGSIFGCICAVKPCIRKCCPENQQYNLTFDGDEPRIVCEESEITSFESFYKNVYSTSLTHESIKDERPINISDGHFYFVFGDVCGVNNKFQKEPVEFPEDVHYLLENGKIINMVEPLYIDHSEYCMESFKGNNSKVHTFQCLPKPTEEEDAWIFEVLAFGLIFSIPFFLTTFLIYAILPQLQNLHGKTLMSHVASLTVAYMILATVQIMKSNFQEIICRTFAYIMQFTFLSSFFWLNIMCFDIWWAFSGLMPLRGSQQEAETKKFRIYSVYAWGSPALIVLTTGIIDQAPFIPDYFIKPHFALDKCWFYDIDAEAIYFYIPIAVLVGLNLIMFTTTALRLQSHMKDTKMFQTVDSKKHNEDRQRFSLYLKLFIVMGSTWVLEVVSFAVGGPKLAWLLTDFGNTLQGLLIFIIFVCNRRTLRLLNQKLCPSLKIIKPTSSMKYNSRTSSTLFSRSNSSSTFKKLSVTKI